MPSISRRYFFRVTLLLLAAGMAALVAIIGTSIWLVDRTQTYTEEVVRARSLQSAAAELLATLQDAETGQRGYLLTGEESYLEPFNDAKSQYEGQVARLTQATQDLPVDRGRVAQLTPLVKRKLGELQETVDLARAGRSADALALVRTNRGKALMDEARTIFEALLDSAETRLNLRIAEAGRTAEALWWTTIGGGMFILLVTLAGAATIVRYTNTLTRTWRDVEALNTGLEERVRERTADLARANDEVQRFAYIVTHDLRAPLVNIMGFTSELEASLDAIRTFITSVPEGSGDRDFVEARQAAVEDVPEALGFIRSSTRKMDGLINAILKLSREGRRTLKPEAVDLEALLTAAGNIVAHQLAEADGSFDLNVGVPTIVSDRLSLEQVVGNLLDNAVKYRSPERPPKIRVTVRPALANRIRIEFEDNGRGIAEQDRERVFELFRRAGVQNTPGEGIGLAHVRALVRNLGGDITLSSRFGQGTTFSIDLPRDMRAFLGSKSA